MRTFAQIFVTFSLALLVGALILLVSGRNPFEVYGLLVEQSLGNRLAIADTLLNATPLIFTGLATAVAFRAGLFNIGVEGSLYLGGFAAAWCAFTFLLVPGWLLIPTAFLAAGLIGLLWAFIPGVLRAYFNVDEVVTTLLLNFVAIGFTSYLVTSPFQAPGAANNMSPMIAAQAQLPRLLPPSQVNVAFLLALVVMLATAFLLWRTTLGYQIRGSGLNALFARAVGMPVARVVVLTMCLSGFIGGLAGASQILGVHYRFVQGFSPNYGFDGITVALLANNHPFGVMLGAFLFGALRNGSSAIQLFTDIPLDLINILQGLVILLVTVRFSWRFRRPGRKQG